MLPKKKTLLEHIDSWLELMFQHFENNKEHGRMFFFAVGRAILLWSTICSVIFSLIMSYYMGSAIFTAITKLTSLIHC